MQRHTLGSDGHERLARMPIFAGLSTGELRALARVADELVAAPGEALMHQGEQGYEVLFVEEGSAFVRHTGDIVGNAGAGDVVGELAVLDPGGERAASIVVQEPLRAVVLTSHFMHHVRRQLPEIAAKVDAAAKEHLERLREHDGGTS